MRYSDIFHFQLIPYCFLIYLIAHSNQYSNLIKNNFDLKDNEKELLELNTELNEQIKTIKSNLDTTENDKYNNISFSEEQLEEAIVRLILFYSELKIQDLINQIDLSKDTSLFPEVEELKKNMEYYQNTL